MLHDVSVPATVVVISGPSGSGKSRLAARLGLPVLRLDDFYDDGDDPALPCLDLGGGRPLTDWDDPASWDLTAAVEAITALCRDGVAQIPTYDIAASRRTGHRRLALQGSPHFVAEGIFAQETVAACRERGILAAAICVTQRPTVTFLRRFSRDLSEHRKPPMVRLRRGVRLWREQRAVVTHAEALGCRVLTPATAYDEIRALVSSPR